MNRAHLPLQAGTSVTIEATGQAATIVLSQPSPDAQTGYVYYLRLEGDSTRDKWTRMEREDIRVHHKDGYTRVKE